jgi:HAD superfamily hydrolase (TIGR01484 family)
MKPYKNQDPIRLVVADVDGTLVTQEKVLTAKTKEAVSKLTAAGIAFAITSGRRPRGMQMVIKDVNLSTVVAGFNGGVYTTAKLDSIAMGNASKEVQAEANFVTASNEEEGFAQAIERFVLNQTSISSVSSSA